MFLVLILIFPAAVYFRIEEGKERHPPVNVTYFYDYCKIATDHENILMPEFFHQLILQILFSF